MDQLRLFLQAPTAESKFFLFDVQTRLDAIVRRSGKDIKWSTSQPTTELLASISPEISAMLVQEAGRHRAQYVPSNSQTGRIVTAHVEVYVPRTPAITQVVRTYNYPVRLCTNHQTQQVQSLDDALAGAR
jgi:protein subunit release factor A